MERLEIALKSERLGTLSLRMANEPVERSCARIRGLNHIVVDVCCKHPDKEEVDESFFQQLELASSLQALILTGGLTQPNICWKGNTAGQSNSRRFQHCLC